MLRDKVEGFLLGLFVHFEEEAVLVEGCAKLFAGGAVRDWGYEGLAFVVFAEERVDSVFSCSIRLPVRILMFDIDSGIRMFGIISFDRFPWSPHCNVEQRSVK